jgi:hypothetical protein
MGTGAEDSDVTYQNDAYTQFKNLENGYWLQFLPQLGFTGPTTKEIVNFPGTENEERTTTISDEAAAAIQQFKAQGYDVVINPDKIDSGSKSVTEFAFKTPDGKLQKTWEYTGGAWYEQVAPYLGLVLPGILGMAGITAGSLGASVTGQTSNALLNNAVGGAIIGGAKELITSGGDVESAIKGALTGGALGVAAELAQPYIKDAANALSQLTGDEVAQLAGTDVAATDVAGNVGDVDVGGVGDVGVPAGVEQMSSVANFSPEAMQTYANEIAAGASRDLAYARAALVENQLQAAQSIYDRTMTPDVADAMLAGGSAPPVVNNLAGAAAPVTPPPANALISDPYAGLAENFPVSQAPVDFTPQPVAPSPGVATVDLTAKQVLYDPYTGLAENFPVAPTFVAPPVQAPVATPPIVYDPYAGLAENFPIAPTPTIPVAPPATDFTLGTGTDTTGAGLGSISGPGITATPGAGLDLSAGTGVSPGGVSEAITGGTGITPGTTGGAGLDTSGLMLGGALGAGAAAGSALPVGSAAAAGSALNAGTAAGAAAGLTGIPVVDDFLKYIGTPAGAAALGAFGSLASGYLTGQAAKDAANIQAQSAQNALALQREQFEYQKGLLEPYRKAGESALGRLTGAMGLGGQAGGPQQLLEMDPGYAFRLGEGMKALERVQAARGNMLSGGAIKAGQRYAQDFASGEYGNAYNRLANIAGLGQTVGGQLGTAAQQFGQTAGETMSQGANALAAGRVGRTSGYMGGIGGAVGAYQNYQNQQQQNQLFGRYLDIYGRAVGAGV